MPAHARISCRALDKPTSISAGLSAMRAEGLEPPRVSPRGPKPRASASSATPAAARGRAAELPHARGRDCMVAAMADAEPRIEHPNRKKAASQITRVLVIVLLLVS